MKPTVCVAWLMLSCQCIAPSFVGVLGFSIRSTSGRLQHPLSRLGVSIAPPNSCRFNDVSRLWMAEGDSDGEADDTDLAGESSDEAMSDAVDDGRDPEEVSRLQRLRRRLFPPKPDDGLTFRQRLAKAGLSVVLSYGWVSNVSYSVTVSLAWYIFSKRTGLSPLAPGQWKSFLAVYAGFYVFNNIVRPVRFALSVSVSMYFDRIINTIQEKFRVSKGVAIGLTVFLANVVGTIALMCLGISIAAAAAGVPVFAPTV